MPAPDNRIVVHVPEAGYIRFQYNSATRRYTIQANVSSDTRIGAAYANASTSEWYTVSANDGTASFTTAQLAGVHLVSREFNRDEINRRQNAGHSHLPDTLHIGISEDRVRAINQHGRITIDTPVATRLVFGTGRNAFTTTDNAASTTLARGQTYDRNFRRDNLVELMINNFGRSAQNLNEARGLQRSLITSLLENNGGQAAIHLTGMATRTTDRLNAQANLLDSYAGLLDTSSNISSPGLTATPMVPIPPAGPVPPAGAVPPPPAAPAVPPRPITPLNIPIPAMTRMGGGFIAMWPNRVREPIFPNTPRAMAIANNLRLHSQNLRDRAAVFNATINELRAIPREELTTFLDQVRVPTEISPEGNPIGTGTSTLREMLENNSTNERQLRALDTIIRRLGAQGGRNTARGVAMGQQERESNAFTGLIENLGQSLASLGVTPQANGNPPEGNNRSIEEIRNTLGGTVGQTMETVQNPTSPTHHSIVGTDATRTV